MTATYPRVSFADLERWPEEPDLAIEILSPSTAGNDRGRKMPLLARHGVREFWLVDADAVAIEIYCLSGNQFALASTAHGAERVQSSLLPEISLAPADLTSDF